MEPSREVAPHGAEDLRGAVRDARARTCALLEDLDAGQLAHVPCIEIVNPPLWEFGHVAWFQERWVLRETLGHAPLLPGEDAWWDSAAVHHDSRWELNQPDREACMEYAREVEARTLQALDERPQDDVLRARARLTVLHEDMHAEAFLYTRQTLGWAPPAFLGRPGPGAAPVTGDAEIPGGKFRLGAERGSWFALDNEQWAHGVEVAPFAISRASVTQGELAAFADDGGYARRDLWTDEGWAWREAQDITAPAYWRRVAGRWFRRVFDREQPLAEDAAAVHVCAHEAEAWCRWADRRLPTELEWEVAAAGEPRADGLGERKRRYPWGGPRLAVRHAALDFHPAPSAFGHPAGDSAFGVRGMLGGVWEWTASRFEPYPGFTPGVYREYSAPWFGGTHRVLRGGSWATTGRLIGNTFRNYYTPERRDPYLGFRSCRLG